MKNVADGTNLDSQTVAGFGEEWESYDQTALPDAEWQNLFERYFEIFPWARVPQNAEGFDLGCGSGRWAAGVIDRVGVLNCIDPSAKALDVCRSRLSDHKNARFFNVSVDAIPLKDGSQDFGYSLGVLHHIPDTASALADCIKKLKPGAPFLLYIYYAFDNRASWYRVLWKVSDGFRLGICRMPFRIRRAFSTTLAAAVYWPLARCARLFEDLGFSVDGMPLSSYRTTSFYTMRTDALDRFGTRLEKRFTREQVKSMMEEAGLKNVQFSPKLPYWVAVGTRK